MTRGTLESLRSSDSVAILSLIVLTCAVLSGALGHGFVFWDDDVNVYANPHLQSATLQDVGWFWAHPYRGLWIPLTYTVWAGLARLATLPAEMFDEPSGDVVRAPFDATPFHAANLLLHVGAVILCYRVLSRLLRRGGLAPAFGAALFAIHPLQVEPVAWVTGLKDVLSGTLALLSIDFYLRSPHAKAGTYALATLAFLASVLAKPATIVLPIILLLIDGVLELRPRRRTALLVAPWFAIGAASVAVTFFSQGSGSFRFESGPAWARPLVALDALGFYLAKFLLPLDLGPDYSRSPLWLLEQWFVWVTWIAPMALGFLVWRVRPPREVALGLLVFAAALLPNLGLVPFAYQVISTVADRYAYFASFGLALASAALFDSAPRRIRAAAFVALALLSFLSFRQVSSWRNTDVLLERGLAANPASWILWYNKGVIANARGEFEGAALAYERALEINPGHTDAWTNLGADYARRGELPRAMEAWRRALALEPDHFVALRNLVNRLVEGGKFAEAVEAATRSYQASHQTRTRELLARVTRDWGVAELAAGRGERALELLAQAVQIDDRPEHREALARARMSLGNSFK